MNPIFCANNCGFFGSSETRNMCSKCYNDFLKSEVISKTTSIIESSNSAVNKHRDDEVIADLGTKKEVLEVTTKMGELMMKSVKKRCNNCNKKVGLTGFKCRCGSLFCARHRLPEEHACQVNYKTNSPNDANGNPSLPQIKGDKLQYRI